MPCVRLEACLVQVPGSLGPDIGESEDAGEGRANEREAASGNALAWC